MKYLCVFVLACLSTNLAFGQNPDTRAQVLDNFLTDDVVAVGYLNLAKIDAEAALSHFEKLGFDDAGNRAQFKTAVSMIKANINGMRDAGIGMAYLLFRASDLEFQGTSWVIPIAQGKDATKAAELIRNYLNLIPEPMNQSAKLCQVDGNLVFIAAAQSQIDRLKTDRPNNPRKTPEAWSAVGSGAAGIFVIGDSDTRRAMRELFPKLPKPFEAVTGDLLADELEWGGVELTIAPNFNIKVEIQTRSETAASIVEDSAQNGLALLQQLPDLDQYLSGELSDFVFGSVKPIRTGTRVQMSLAELTSDMDRLAKIVAPQIRSVRQSAQDAQQKNNLRQFALGILNYESAYRHFPPRASVDENGKPLLSWRVHILPFIEEDELYRQFKLDEPWDSEHNLKLVDQMPRLYADLKGNVAEAQENNKQGRTIFQVPVGPGTIYEAQGGIGFKDLTDGSSNTILLTAVARKHAVIWTQPADWEVDMANPWAKLQEPGRTNISAAIADGSVQEIPMTTPVEKLRAYLTIAGGEIIRNQ